MDRTIGMKFCTQINLMETIKLQNKICEIFVYL